MIWFLVTTVLVLAAVVVIAAAGFAVVFYYIALFAGALALTVLLLLAVGASEIAKTEYGIELLALAAIFLALGIGKAVVWSKQKKKAEAERQARADAEIKAQEEAKRQIREDLLRLQHERSKVSKIKANDNMDNDELRIALFGFSGSGKTTFLASYYGNLQRSNLDEDRNWRLLSRNPEDDEILLGRYHGLEQGEFPLGTEQFSTYTFDFQIKHPESGYIPAPFSIAWYDYPGGWWTTNPKDHAEETERKEAFRNLLESQVGILMIDSEQYLRSGTGYIKKLFDTLRNGIARNRRLYPGEETPFPETWIIAITKADLLKGIKSLREIADDITKNAAQELKELNESLILRDFVTVDPSGERISQNSSFGEHFILLSAVLGDKGKVADARAWIGLDLIAPLAIKGMIQKSEAHEKKQEASKKKKEGFINLILNIFSPIEHIINTRAPFLSFFSEAAKGIAHKQLIQCRTEIDEHIRSGDLLRAIFETMEFSYRRSRNQGHYLNIKK